MLNVRQIVLGLKNCTVAFCDARTGDTVRQIRDFGSEIVGLDIPHRYCMHGQARCAIIYESERTRLCIRQFEKDWRADSD